MYLNYTLHLWFLTMVDSNHVNMFTYEKFYAFQMDHKHQNILAPTICIHRILTLMSYFTIYEDIRVNWRRSNRNNIRQVIITSFNTKENIITDLFKLMTVKHFVPYQTKFNVDLIKKYEKNFNRYELDSKNIQTFVDVIKCKLRNHKIN